MAVSFDPPARGVPIEAHATWPFTLSLLVPLLGALACSGSGSAESGRSGNSGGQTIIPSNGGAQVGMGGGSSTGGTAIGSGGVPVGAGGVAMGAGGGIVGQGGTPGCTQQCSGNSLTTTCANSQATQDCGTICRRRSLVGTECVGTDCVCTSGQGGGGAGGAPSCTTECAGPGSLRTTCGGSVSTSDCGTVCRNRGLTGTVCTGSDCVCASGPGCTLECAGPSSLKTTCGTSSSTQDCGSICRARNQTGTQCSGGDCACQTITGAGGSGTGGAGTGGAGTGCTTVCQDDPTYHQGTIEITTCIDAQGNRTTTLACTQTGGPCEGGLATCENNACKCL